MSTSSSLHLGEELDDAGARNGTPVHVRPSDLTTHGVILGMTGSGKTGLGVVLLEEVLARGIPALILDPKGDMGNLLLNFPSLQTEEFRPWVDEAEARRKNISMDELAADIASTWKNGLESWDLDGDDLRKLKDSARYTIFTPGSDAGLPIDVVGSLAAPDGPIDAEVLSDEVDGFTSGLLGLVGRDSNPISSPDHILISNLITRAWTNGESLDLPTLVSQIADPPIRKLGVFDLDTFLPPARRQALAVQLNALLASPSFTQWMRGVPLDIDRLLYDETGKPRAAIVYLAHLTEAESQFIVTLIMSKMVGWMRRQPGTSGLRALIYMDEVAGYAPPSAMPPSKKPILTIFKQARAHGLGMVLSTQNPVDIDYKAMSNAGTWMIGRLQTERDKARVLEGLRSAAGGSEIRLLDEMIGGLGQRQFLYHTSRGGAPRKFTTRWAMSYLRGPLTRIEIGQLMAEEAEQSPTQNGAETGSTPQREAPPENHVRIQPKVASRIRACYLDPSAPWASEVGADPQSIHFEASVAVRVHLKYNDRRAGIDHDEEYECIYFPLSATPRPEEAHIVDYDERDLRSEAPSGATYLLPVAPIDKTAFFRSLENRLKDALYRTHTKDVLVNRTLDKYARVGEPREEFVARCRKAAAEKADEDAARLRESIEKKLDRLITQQRRAEDRVRELTADSQQRLQQELIAGAGQILNIFMKGRGSVTSLSGAASRRGTTRRIQERLATAQGKLDEVTQSMVDIEAELADDLIDIKDKWDANAEEIETMSISLFKKDIIIEESVLLWVPIRA